MSTVTNRIDALFDGCGKSGQTVFIPFLTAGDPDLETTRRLALAISQRADRANVPVLFEFGFPYSDPIADGAVIQASYTRALAKNVRLAQIFETIKKLRADVPQPFVAMASYSLAQRRGPAAFFADAKTAGFDGLILPDLPVEEAQGSLELANANGLRLIQLVAPTTPASRAEKIVKSTTGFVYLVAVTGITGARDQLPVELPKRIAEIRQMSKVPVCVGFGISRPDHVRLLKGVADGVIVGSAIVSKLANLEPGNDAQIQKLADEIAELFGPLA